MEDGTAESVTFTAAGYTPGQPVTLDMVSGDNQFAEVGQPLGTPLVVTVADIQGDPVSSVAVDYAIIAGDATLGTVDPVATDALGIAENTITFGPTAGQAEIVASVPGLIGSPVTFSAVAVLQGGSGTDYDGDGLPNDWETANSLNPRRVPQTEAVCFFPCATWILQRDRCPEDRASTHP